MMRLFGIALILAASCVTAAQFPPTRPDGSTAFYFKLVDSKCIPQQLIDELRSNGVNITQTRESNDVCCPMSANTDYPQKVPAGLWDRVRPFSATLSQANQTEEQQCSAPRMGISELNAIHSANVAAEAKVRAKRAADEGRPIPPNWKALAESRHPEDIALVKSIKKMKWWDACVQWGRETRKKRNSHEASALRDFLLHDRAINGIDLEIAFSKEPKIGQTACGVMALLGRPDSINYSKTASRQSAQYVYRSRRIYIYTEADGDDANGIVRSIQF